MKTYAIEEGEFATNGDTDEYGNIVGELTNHRGTRRHVVRPDEIKVLPDLPVQDAVVIEPPSDVTPIVTKGGKRR